MNSFGAQCNYKANGQVDELSQKLSRNLRRLDSKRLAIPKEALKQRTCLSVFPATACFY